MTADADSSAVVEATTSFLEDHGEEPLEVVLKADSASETWTFDDVGIDSGTFGELVSRGIVEKVDGAYQLADPASVRAIVSGDTVPTASDSDEPRDWFGSIELGIWGDRRALGGLFGALVALFLLRITQFRSVFQGEYVVSPGNDAYHYRYWTETLLAESSGSFEPGLLANMPSGTLSRPLTHAMNWLFAVALGGDQWAASMVAAWLPVVATLVLGVVIYATAVVLTRDVRVGIASVLFFAVTPIHAVYTGVGFLEHRLHQYLWLGVTLLTLTWLAVDSQRRLEAGGSEALREQLWAPQTWLVVGVLGIAVVFSTHSWAGSPLLLLPLALYIGVRAAVDVRAGVSPLLTNAPVIVGVAIGAVLSAGLHLSWGWQENFIAFTPALIVLGALAVGGLGELWRRYSLPPVGLIGVQAVGALFGIVVARLLVPDVYARIQSRADDLLLREGFTESVSLFSTELAVILGPLAQLGLGFYLGVAVLGWVVLITIRRHEPAWLLFAVYVPYIIVLAAIQARFAAQLAIVISILAGLGFVYLLSAIDLARRPRVFGDTTTDSSRPLATDGGQPHIALPDRRQTAYILAIGLLICGFSLIYVPALSAQTTHSEAQLEAALVLEDHSQEFDREWRDNAAFSSFGTNRMYNYFISGESRDYRYVDSMYGDFVMEDDPDGWVDTFDGRFGYMIANEDDGLPPERFGIDGERSLEHYQLLYLSDDGELGAFAIVEGATIVGEGEPGESVTVATEVDVDGHSFAYERTVDVGEDGEFSVTVPYPGEYTVGEDSLEVSEEDVENGETVRLE